MGRQLKKGWRLRARGSKGSVRGWVALGALPGLAAVGVAAALLASTASATGGPSGWLAVDGNIRSLNGSGSASVLTPPVDWGNSGTTFNNTTCANGGIHA